MDLEKMSVAELVAMMEEQDGIRLAAKQRGRQIKAVLERRLEEEHAANYAATPLEYRAAKALARPDARAQAELDAAHALLAKADRRLATAKRLQARFPEIARQHEEAGVEMRKQGEAAFAKAKKALVEAKDRTRPLTVVLNDHLRLMARQGRELQSRTVEPAAVGVAATK